jgi:hypothetical protein
MLGIAKVEGEIRVADELFEPKGELRVESLRIGEREWRREARAASVMVENATIQDATTPPRFEG